MGSRWCQQIPLLSQSQLSSSGEGRTCCNQHLIDCLVAVSINLREPALDSCETLFIGHVIHNNDTVCPSVVAAGDGTESLLTSCIPNLQLDYFPVDLNSSDFEVDAYGTNVGFGVSIISETQEKARLAHARVSDEKELEEVVVFGSVCH